LLRYSLGRLLGAIPTLLLLIAFSFFMIRAAPGGPFSSERQLLPEIEANLNAAYHLDEPLYQQFGRYLWGLAHFDFGPSFQYRDYTVTELIMTGFPVSLRLGGGAIIELDASEEDAVSILANNLPVARGTVVVNGNRIAVNVAELLPRPPDMR